MHLLKVCTKDWKKDSNNVLVDQVKELKNSGNEEHGLLQNFTFVQLSFTNTKFKIIAWNRNITYSLHLQSSSFWLPTPGGFYVNLELSKILQQQNIVHHMRNITWLKTSVKSPSLMQCFPNIWNRKMKN